MSRHICKYADMYAAWDIQGSCHPHELCCKTTHDCHVTLDNMIRSDPWRDFLSFLVEFLWIASKQH